MCAIDMGWIAQAFKNQNEQSNDIWDNVSKTGQYLNNSELKRQELEQAQQQHQAQLAMEQQKLAAAKEHQDRSYELDYQKTMQGAKANQLKEAINMQRLQIDQNKENRASWDFNNKVERDNYMKQNADKYAKAVINKDASVLSKEDWAVLPPKEQINLLKTISGSSQDLINREKGRVLDGLGDSYVEMIEGIDVDPKDGSSNATEKYKNFLRTKIQPMINSGMYDRKAIAEVTNYISSMVGKTASMKKASIKNTVAPDIVTEYSDPIEESDLPEDTGVPITNRASLNINPSNLNKIGSSAAGAEGLNDEIFKALNEKKITKQGTPYTLDSPENIQKYQNSLLAGKKIALQDRGKGGALNSIKLQGGAASSGKKKNEPSEIEKQVRDAIASRNKGK